MPKGILANPIKRTCLTCEIEFDAYNYQSTYCSNTCRNKGYYKRHREKTLNRGYALWKKYKITFEEYQDMIESQNGKCLICEQTPEILYVDHCHETKMIRGLLCMTCNAGLGLFKDNQMNLERAIKYLDVAELRKVKGA